MSKPRILLVVLVFVALAALELVTGSSRLAALREGRTEQLIEAVERGQQELVRRLREQLDDAGRLARFLAQLDETAALLSAAPAPASAPPTLAACLDHFAGVDQLLVLDGDGAPRLRLARDGAGRAVPLPDPSVRLAPAPPTAERLARVRREGLALPDLAPGTSGPPPLLAAPVGSPRGWLVLALSPGSLQAALAGLQPVTPLTTRLLAGAGPDEATRTPGEDGSLRLTTASDGRGPAFRLETTVPAAALEAAMEPIGREYAFVLGSMIVVTLVLGVVGALVLRLGLRTLRLNETEHYLRWIRRVTDRYRALLEGAADMILILEPGGALREANAAARQTLGLAPPAEGTADGPPRGAASDATADPLGERLTGDGAGPFAEAVARAGREPGRALDLPGLSLRAADGAERMVDARVAGVDVGGEQLVQVSLRDVTDQRAVERRLQTAERLGSLGLLTAGVAHEINNPLEGMGNYLALLERGELPADRRQRYLGEVRRGLHRIRDIVRDLLAFARPSLDSQRADLTRVVDEALSMVRYSRDVAEVSVERQGLDEPLAVAGDPGRLGQVVLNLLLNAVQAAGPGGRVLLRGGRERTGEADERVLLEVLDDGPGLSDEALASLFDPFFSGTGGTGLGLAVSFGIIEAHGGDLSAANRPEGGACLRLTLPALSDDPTPGSDRP